MKKINIITSLEDINNGQKIVDIEYDNIRDKILIMTPTMSDNILSIKHGNSKTLKISKQDFIDGKFIDYIYDEKFYYKIGETIITEKKNFIIIDREYRQEINKKTGSLIKIKYYLIHCNKCGYEFWKNEGSLKNKKDGCAACCPTPQVVVSGINDIPTTAPWMIDYFQGNTYDEKKENASKYTAKSSKKNVFQCPDCGKIKDKEKPINYLFFNHSIGCKCSDHKSFPNKFSYAFLEQLPIINWCYEWQPNWLYPYFYDNYFEYNNKKYVLELDGNVGHGRKQFKNSTKKDIDGKARDDLKDKLAQEHDVIVIRINAINSTKDYLKNQILSNNIIHSLFGNLLKDIDWNKCLLYATKNIIKEVCEYWETNNHPCYEELKSKFKIKYNGTIQDYLKKGSELGWCNYDKKAYRKECQVKYNANSISVYLEEDNTYLITYQSQNEFNENFKKDFGTTVCRNKYKQVISGLIPSYKGFVFKENEGRI